MDKRNLAKYVIDRNVLDGERVRTLSPEIELVGITMHTVFPEKTFPLELFYTITHTISMMHEGQTERLLSFARSNHMQIALKTCLTITAALHQEVFNTIPEKLQRLIHSIGYLAPEAKQLRMTGLEMPHKITTTAFWLAFLEKLLELNALRSLFIQFIHMLNPVFAREAFKSLIDRHTKGKYHHV